MAGQIVSGLRITSQLSSRPNIEPIQSISANKQRVVARAEQMNDVARDARFGSPEKVACRPIQREYFAAILRRANDHVVKD